MIKLFKLLNTVLVTVISVLLFSCNSHCTDTYTYTDYVPITKSMKEMRNEFAVLEAKELGETGKLYLYRDYLFINEPAKGVHIIDNSDKTNPKSILFLNVPGNYDMAVKNSVLYLDSYVDLLALDISDLGNIKLLNREEDVFLEYGSSFWGYKNEQGDFTIITAYEEKEIVVNQDCDDVYDVYYPRWSSIFLNGCISKGRECSVL